MNLSLSGDFTAGRVSSQARGAVESWSEENLYCANCSSPRLKRLAPNTQPNDFACPNCYFRFQLKGQKSRLGNSLSAGAHETLMKAVQRDEAPSYYFLHYDAATWAVLNLLLVPHFAIPPSAIVKRPGAAGCRFALDRIPTDARIPIITTIKSSGQGDTECVMISRPEEVREKFRRLKPLSDIPTKQRALALEILNIARRIAARNDKASGNAAGIHRPTFTNEEVYAYERELARSHPGYRRVRDKIRQQLYALKEAGFLTRPERGVWKLK